VSTSEELREALLDLEEVRKKEVLHRQMAEALLDGLRVLVTSKDPHTLFMRLFDTMKEPLDFASAFVILQNHDGALVTLTTSNSVFAHTVWQPGAMLRRVLAGQPVAVFDTLLVDEWNMQPEEVLEAARSALHFSIRTTDSNAIMVCTHPDRAHFSRNHVTLARRFSVLATQALQKLESDEKLADLEKQLETQASMAELNRRLAESEQKLSRAKKMEAVGLLAGGVAHDLNNILTGIVSYPDLLLMDEDVRPEYREALETIRDAGLRAAAVVDDLLTVAKGAASPREPLNLNSIVDAYLSSPEHQGLLEAHDGVTVDRAPGGDLLNVMGSPIHITKSLMNLTYNAVEALQGKGGGKVLVRTENRYVDRPLKGYTEVRPGEYIVLSVHDNGIGIPPEDLERIFEPFYTRKKMGRSGTGLGLTIVWNVMEDHGGYVDVTTDEHGTEFTLYFPAIREALPDTSSFSRFDDYKGNGETILVVDDLEDQRKTACAILKKLGYTAHSVESGEKALEYLKDRPVDILLLDMIMDPGMNGMETYRRISEIHPGQKAIIASGYSMSEDVVAAQHMGAGVFVKKPYTIAKLGQALKEELTK